jgi:hypothetical protein
MPEKLKYSSRPYSSHGVIECPPLTTPERVWLFPTKPDLRYYVRKDPIVLDYKDRLNVPFEYHGKGPKVKEKGIEMQNIYFIGPEELNPRPKLTVKFFPRAELVKHKGNMWKKFVEGFRTLVFCGYVH